MGAAQLELAGGVGEDPQGRRVEVGRQQRVDDVLTQVRQQEGLEVDPGLVLGRDQDGVDRDRPAVLVDHAHLRLAVGPQVREHADPAHLGETLGQAVRQPDGQRHEVGRLVAGVAEHHPLVARALGVEEVLAARSGAQFEGRVDALGDVW